MQQTVTLSKEQARAFALVLLPATIRAYIDANRKDFEKWLAEEKKREACK